ncbi:major facilitator superfamily protein [Corynespora cassiicola Philippines]|uniref:Major facilitator superfamily protein n=1 Tax=Corynespora cassiicola Philippines TaxID=1448308 RepID=A0A2T2P152_CORCC|nr:major facilitator superfamily protein [Corynespora cassiicola Philippines]
MNEKETSDAWNAAPRDQPTSSVTATISSDQYHSPGQQQSDASSSAPPDGGYGWVIVLTVFMVNGFTWGTVAAYSVYLGHYLRRNDYPQASATDFAFVGGFNFSLAVLIAPFVTYIARLYGPRAPMIVGVFLFSGAFLAASFACQLWQLYLTQGIMVGLGVGLIYIPSIAIVSQWFSEKRSLANGICAAGSGIGGLATCFATEAIIQKLDISWALRITAIFVFVTNLIATVLLRSRNSEILPSQKPFDVLLLRNYQFCLLLGWSFVMMFGYITLMFSLPDFSRAIGLTSESSATTAALLNLGAAVGRPLIGFASDKFGRIEITLYLTITCGFMCFGLWVPASTEGLLFTFSILSGAILGIFWAAIGPLTAEIVGLKHLQSGLSLAWLTIVLPTTFAEVIALRLRQFPQSRPYIYPQIFSALSYITASLFLVELLRAKRKQQYGVD